MIKLLLGGSPCTYWSIAQKNNRETEPSGLGWELFKNYLIAKEKFKPDFFLYENNKSADEAIKKQIRAELEVWDGTFLMEDTGARYIEINSALVSAQNRQRFYVHNCGEVEQPEDRGILLRDILESGQGWTDKSYAVTTRDSGAIPEDTLKRKRHTMVAEPVNITVDGKAHTIKAQYNNSAMANFITNGGFPATGVAEPICLNSKSGRMIDGQFISEAQPSLQNRIYSINGKSTAVTTDFMPKIAEPVRVGDMGSKAQAHRIYSIDGKSVCINLGGGGLGAKTGLYAIPIYYGAEAVEFDESGKPTKARSYADGKIYAVYEVKNGKITIKGKEHPIKLADGFYIIRKLTVTECSRLQTLPDDYCKAVSNAQAYKGLGNGWTAEVIIHILNGALRDVPRDTPIKVLSMYDGIGTGRYCLDKMGFTNVKYYAYEIDKYAIQIAKSNYPDIIECGDAFQVRNKDWKL